MVGMVVDDISGTTDGIGVGGVVEITKGEVISIAVFVFVFVVFVVLVFVTVLVFICVNNTAV